MPKVQVVLQWHLDQYERARDDVLKLLAVPVWQTPLPPPGADDESSNPILALLAPALSRTRWASARLERWIAGLRAAEALRLYAAPKGKVPAKWSDITVVPLPIDPFTGKGFDDFYQTQDGRAVLEVPAPLAQFVRLGRRYELAPPVDPKKDR
jgi:hypothetical protein